MKAKKKPRRIGQKIREKEERQRRIALSAIEVTILICIISFSGFLAYSMLNQPSQTVNSNAEPKAAIVDHLSLTAPNQTFIQTATNTLKQAGYTTDYFLGENVTVEFYKDLPTHGYRLIILRVHSSATYSDLTMMPVTLFTSERYDGTKYVYEQLTDQLVEVAFSQVEMEKGMTYFGINPLFITRSMKGTFQSTIIIMMGCEGLENTMMAEAFIGKGAKVYVSWSNSVSASHTDLATAHLLQHFLIEKLTLKEAVRETFKEVGFDPVYQSLLIYYPLEAGDQTIKDIAGNYSTKAQ